MEKIYKEEEEKISWGTWEELLLACAVKRHGTNNWESVANEIKNKKSSSNFIVTPQNCKQKYHDLHQRFMVNSEDVVDSEIIDHHKNDGMDDNLNHDNSRIPWLDELRKLRVAELRREVQEHDVSIVSLQLKVKRLEEEREESLKDKNDSDVKPDLLETRTKEEEEEEDGKKIETEPPRSPSPIEITGKPVPGDESDRDNQSFNESNSSDLKDGKTPEVEVEKLLEPVQTVTETKDHVLNDKPLGEDSCNGSSETIAKDSAVQVEKKSSETTILVRQTREPAELWESAAESKGGEEEGTKESSDVQSSASLSRKNGRRKITSGSSSGEERETEEVSPAIKRISVKSEPLLGFLEMILSHKYGSIFKSRLKSQETRKYKSFIRQHMDMETIRTRLKQGRYSSSCSQKFFRDLLLLFNNAIAFYPKNSSESVAATELRGLVSKEMLSRSSGSSSSRSQNNPSPGDPTPPKLQQSTPLMPKPDLELSDPLLPKSKPVGVIFACRKRSSISAKAANSSKPAELKGSDQNVGEEKPVLAKKQKENSSAVEEQIVFSKRKGERSASGMRSSRSNRNNNTNKNSPKNSNTVNLDPSSARSSAKGGSCGGDDTNSETRTEKDKKNNSNNASTALTNTVAKKRSAANFLNRMKTTSSSSNNGKLLETLKNSSSGNNSKGDKGWSNKEEKYRGRGSGSKKDEQVTKQSSSKRQAAQGSSPPKRSVGRPPKKAPPPPPPSSSKRTREREKEVEPEVRQPRKRTRR
ncbi:hypothetical protein C5167_001539 [Papaver somniferum]|uniref:Bromo domain-containing protein n=1 Tax=Papaver somniferum TaxID=3469 RepID=A0A4Y7KYZ9_PAPSO|nr:uncharacterized protein LOC113309586 [Papaver somniferum]RZC77408.1 hypothetical protein C5167_001539 [Papaver somniferum]